MRGSLVSSSLTAIILWLFFSPLPLGYEMIPPTTWDDGKGGDIRNRSERLNLREEYLFWNATLEDASTAGPRCNDNHKYITFQEETLYKVITDEVVYFTEGRAKLI